MSNSSSIPSLNRRRFLGVAGGASLAAASLAACGGSGGSKSSSGSAQAAALSQAAIDKAMGTPTTLTFWTWLPDVSNEVALFQKKYPAIKVDVVNAGQGSKQYTKLRTALQAGTGAPDICQIEYQYIPTFTITNSLLDLRPYGASDLRSKFVGWTWGQISGPNGEVFAIPQDTGPMGMLYRKDIFDAHGITVPTTWDQFADAAHKLHQADSSVYLTNLSANEPAGWHGLMWQAGAKPYQMVNQSTIKVNVDDAASQKVAQYWGQLTQAGVVSTDPDFTDAWYTGFNKGTYATWLTAAWGPLFLSGSAKSTSGKWRAAPLPQWDSAAQVSGNWGGSTTAVMKSTKNPIAAAQFAQFLNSDPDCAAMFASKQSLFPSTTALLSSADFIGQQPEFYGGQQVDQVFAKISDTVNQSFQWPPFLDQVVTDWTDTVGAALANKTDAVAALAQWQSKITTYAKGQGFTVETA